MMNSIRKHQIALGLILGFVCGIIVHSPAQERQGRGGGQGPGRERSHAVGVRAQQFMREYRRQDKGTSDATKIIAALDSVAAEGYVHRHMIMKLEEGLAKNVPLDRIADLLDHNLELYRQAIEIAESVRQSGRGGNGMIVLLAMALESGVEGELLTDLLQRSEDMSRGAARAVVSATEIMRLRNIDHNLGMAFIDECIEMNANRPQILKGINLLSNSEWQNQSYGLISEELWFQIRSQSKGDRSGGEHMARGRLENDERQRRHQRPPQNRNRSTD